MKIDILCNAKLLDRFWSKVDKKSNDECWNWLAAKLRDGYGNIRVNGKTVQAHRLSWVLTFGEIPNGMDVLHSCDNPSCVNPRHLFLGNDWINSADRVSKGRQAKGERNPRTKFTSEIIMRIRELYSSGQYSMRLLSREFGITYSHVNAILHDRAWK